MADLRTASIAQPRANPAAAATPRRQDKVDETREHEPRLRGVVKPAFTSADEDLIAGLQTEGRGRPGGQLDHALCAPDEPHHPPPCVQVRIDLLHAFLAVKENCVDRKPHQDHGDAAPLARVDPHPTSWLQGAAEHEADGSAEDGAGNHEVFGQRFAGTFMHGSRTRHLNGVAYRRGWSSTATVCACITSSTVPSRARRWSSCTGSRRITSSTGLARAGRRRSSTRGIASSALTAAVTAEATSRTIQSVTRWRRVSGCRWCSISRIACGRRSWAGPARAEQSTTRNPSFARCAAAWPRPRLLSLFRSSPRHGPSTTWMPWPRAWRAWRRALRWTRRAWPRFVRPSFSSSASAMRSPATRLAWRS